VKKHFWRNLKKTNLFIRLGSWEYWPFGIVQFPFFFYWLWFGLKARSLIFFSASNPCILMGGMFGESKYDMLRKIPDQYVAKSAVIQYPATSETVSQIIRSVGLSFPVIFKPDLGERGWMVRRINSREDIEKYLEEIKINFIVQEFIDLPLEFGVFYRRFPSRQEGEVVSIVMKEMLTVVGDGESSLRDLILTVDRAKLQFNTLAKKFAARLDHIPARGEEIELVSIGNHCLGTKFLNGNHLINARLNKSFNMLSHQIKDFFFGRYDLRAASLADLEEGKIKIMELNGCGAEPAHIYHPGFSIWEAMEVMHRHWTDLYRISIENHRSGIPFVPFKEGLSIYRKFKKSVGT
jgi:hypothetical protein